MDHGVLLHKRHLYQNIKKCLEINLLVMLNALFHLQLLLCYAKIVQGEIKLQKGWSLVFGNLLLKNCCCVLFTTN